MKLSNSSTVPVYTVAGSSTARPIPEWLAKRRNQKKGHDYANKIELLQDFEFEEASQCIRISDDGQWAMSTGTYKPQIHAHYLPNLALSFARHTDTINKTFLILSSDYSKTVHLQEDRSIEFHTPGGCHYRLRIPRYGRDLAYNKNSAELLVPAVGVNGNGMGEVYRVNLEQGRFMRPYEVDVGGDDFASAGGGALQGGINTGSVNTAVVASESHNLMAFGTSLGTVEYWDSRSRDRVTTLQPPTDQFEDTIGVTALDFHRSGMTTAVGTSNGLIYLYDLRSPVPLLKKDQGYGYPIQTLQFLTPSTATRNQTLEPKILSADKRIIKIWNERDGSPWTSVEPAVDINCVAWCKDTGMILTANEGKQQHAFFIPQLGPAPKWCTFLDNMVEEMADDPNDPNSFTNRKAGEVYDNYKFLTLPQLKALNLDHLIGKTNLLRPYMHGHFVKQELYDEARLIANPSSWEEERSKRIQEKIDKERESRIRGKKKVAAKVNRKLAERVLDREEKNERRRAQRILANGGDKNAVEITSDAVQSEPQGLLGDSRFAKLFQDEDFEVDETSHEFRSINPSTKTAANSNMDREKGLTAVEEEMVDEVPGSSDEESNEDAHHSRASNKISTADYKRRSKLKQSRPMQMSVSSLNGARPRKDTSFESRVAKMKPKERAKGSGGVVGERVVTFEPQVKRKDQQAVHNTARPLHKDRRSASKNKFRGM